jgi:ABC-2 type transport system permease protein
MKNAFWSQWIKLRRRPLLLGTFGGLALAASFFEVLVFAQAPPANGRNIGGSLPSLSELAQPNGLMHGLDLAVVMLGVLAFGVAAAQIGGEYSLGTLRQVLVRQPRRGVWLAGTYLAVISFLVCALVVAAGVTGVVDIALAHLRHVPVGAWFSSAGITDLSRALGELALTTAGFATLGMAVGLLVRSSVVAVIIGLAYLLPMEQILIRIFPHAQRWLPGATLSAVGQGGTGHIPFGNALLMGLLYMVVVGGMAVYAFVRRDVTA